MNFIVTLDGEFVDAAKAHNEPNLYQAEMHRAKQLGNAKCLCVTDAPIGLVVRKLGRGHILAAWPGTVENHSEGCPFRGEHRPAITANRELNQKLKNDAQELIYRSGWRSDDRLDQGSSDGNITNVDLTWLLSELWQESMLSAWKHGWRRDWSFVKSRLLKVAAQKVVNRASLASRLYVPSTFKAIRKAEINAVWSGFLKPLKQRPFTYSVDDSQPPYFTSLVIGELGSIAWTSGTWVIRLRNHSSEFGLVPEAAETIDPRLTSKLQQLSVGGKCRPVVALCVAIDHLGLLHVLDMAILKVSSLWLPASLPIEHELIDALIKHGHEFHITKGHRWGAGAPYLVCKHPSQTQWISVFTYGSSMSTLKLQQYRTKVDAESAKLGRINRFVGHADAINKVLCANEIHRADH